MCLLDYIGNIWEKLLLGFILITSMKQRYINANIELCKVLWYNYIIQFFEKGGFAPRQKTTTSQYIENLTRRNSS